MSRGTGWRARGRPCCRWVYTAVSVWKRLPRSWCLQCVVMLQRNGRLLFIKGGPVRESRQNYAVSQDLLRCRPCLVRVQATAMKQSQTRRFMVHDKFCQSHSTNDKHLPTIRSLTQRTRHPPTTHFCVNHNHLPLSAIQVRVANAKSAPAKLIGRVAPSAVTGPRCQCRHLHNPARQPPEVPIVARRSVPACR